MPMICFIAIILIKKIKQNLICTANPLFFSTRDEMKQRVCLDIIHKIIALLTPLQLQEVLGHVTAFISHPSPVCRERMYDILMWILDNYRYGILWSSVTYIILFHTRQHKQCCNKKHKESGYISTSWSCMLSPNLFNCITLKPFEIRNVMQCLYVKMYIALCVIHI